jgi:hypothetical protein
VRAFQLCGDIRLLRTELSGRDKVQKKTGRSAIIKTLVQTSHQNKLRENFKYVSEIRLTKWKTVCEAYPSNSM